MLKNIGLLNQGLFGGTDRIFDDLHHWLTERNYKVSVLNDLKLHHFNEVELIILPTSELHWLWVNRGKINKNCKVMVWCMGHDSLQACFYNSSLQSVVYEIVFSYLYRFFIKKLISRKIFVYTDIVGENLDLNNLKKDLVKESANVLPIPISIPEVQPLTIFDEVNSFFWVGRIDKDFKVWSLLELLDELDLWVLKNNRNVKFYIIGDGDGLYLIDTDKYSFEITTLGNLLYSELEYRIKNEASLVFAMGTSALEGARFSTATIVVNPLREGEKNVTYRWVYDSLGCSLGEFKGCHVYPLQKIMALDLMLNDFLCDPFTYSSKSYEYSKIFDRNIVYDKLLNDSVARPAFGSIMNFMFIPYLSYKLKSIIKNMFDKLL
jgi:glycosyltransferase involved in cell wall biosynthesis